jgi:nitroreductase
LQLTEALLTRRSVRRFTHQAIPRETLAAILSYAPWVPNHHVSEPWRFIVVTKTSLAALADLRRQAVLSKRAGQEDAQARADKARDEFLEAAAVIAVIQRLDPNPVRREEDYAAVAMATYNLMLAAWDRGIGSYWNTGPLMTDSAVRQWLGLSDDERTVAFVRLGLPAIIPVQRRTPAADYTEWRD